MRKLVKRVASFILIPLTRWYLRKERVFKYNNIQVTVFPGVFHPGLFYSTKFILQYLAELRPQEKTFLELGCGTGLISLVAARAGAIVTSSDFSQNALNNTAYNAEKNSVVIKIIHSDLFDNIPGIFDFIVINPPYYAKDATTESELAWNCGKNFQYFKKLFGQLSTHMHASSMVIMVLTKGCDLHEIFSIAQSSGFMLELIREKKVMFDGKDYLYRIKANSFE